MVTTAHTRPCALVHLGVVLTIGKALEEVGHARAEMVGWRVGGRLRGELIVKVADVMVCCLQTGHESGKV